MKLHEDVIEKIYDHALDEYPDECCGIITGSTGIQAVHKCRNIQNELHTENPETYPRYAHTAYVIKREEFDEIVSAAVEKGDGIIALYHSHTEHEAYFSEEDVAAQTVFGEPEFPNALQVVISVMNRKVHDIKCFKWDRNTRSFIVLECS
jgi:adenylyltransferase/sulfurtransferase